MRGAIGGESSQMGAVPRAAARSPNPNESRRPMTDPAQRQYDVALIVVHDDTVDRTTAV